MQFLDKSLAFVVCLILSANCYAQTSSDSMVKVSGTLYALEDSSKIDGRVLYEKMPYYDDMGMASSNKEGIYSIYLLRGNTYKIEVSGSGYETVKSELVPSVGEDTEITKDFYLPISKELRIIKLENLIFARGRSVISSDSFEELDRLVQWLEERRRTNHQGGIS